MLAINELAISKHKGAVLVTSLVFLLVLTLVAVIAMQSTITDQKISTNIAYKTKSLESSESPRPRGWTILDNHVFEREWTKDLFDDGIVALGIDFNDIDGLSLFDENNELRSFYLENTETSDPAFSGSYTQDMKYERTVGNESLKSDISIYRTGAHIRSGHGAAMVAGYEGTGKSAAGSGSSVYFHVISSGTSSANAETTTSADTSVPVRN